MCARHYLSASYTEVSGSSGLDMARAPRPNLYRMMKIVMSDGSTFRVPSALRTVANTVALDRDPANHPVYLVCCQSWPRPRCMYCHMPSFKCRVTSSFDRERAISPAFSGGEKRLGSSACAAGQSRSYSIEPCQVALLVILSGRVNELAQVSAVVGVVCHLFHPRCT